MFQMNNADNPKGEIVVDVRQMVKSYQMGHSIVSALKGVDLQVRRGDMLAIMGPSGSGKSTLMHLLGCLDKPTEGSYLLNGQNISELDDQALSLIRATQIGFVFQSFNLIPQLNVVENVEVPFLYRYDKKQSRNAIVNALERVGLGHRLNHLPTELSGGEMQRVAVARALAVNPFLILADEPTGNLDFETGRSILALFQELNAQGVTIIIVTHDEFVGKHCKRLIRMRDGEIVSEEQIHVNG
jgi:putative ABC transport system ATP-binding protein